MADHFDESIAFPGQVEDAGGEWPDGEGDEKQSGQPVVHVAVDNH